MCEIRKVTDYAKYLHLLLKLNKPSYPRKLQASFQKNRKNGTRNSTERERITTHCFSKRKRTRISCSSESVKKCNVVRWTFIKSTLLSRNVLHFLYLLTIWTIIALQLVLIVLFRVCGNDYYKVINFINWFIHLYIFEINTFLHVLGVLVWNYLIYTIYKWYKTNFFCLFRVCENDDVKVIFINRFIHLYIFKINKIYVSLCETTTFTLYKWYKNNHKYLLCPIVTINSSEM